MNTDLHLRESILEITGSMNIARGPKQNRLDYTPPKLMQLFSAAEPLVRKKVRSLPKLLAAKVSASAITPFGANKLSERLCNHPGKSALVWPLSPPNFQFRINSFAFVT
jgi:hypothetical protein